MRQITVEGQSFHVKDGTTYLELAKNFQKKYDHPPSLKSPGGGSLELGGGWGNPIVFSTMKGQHWSCWTG